MYTLIEKKNNQLLFKNITKFILSNDGKYLLLEKENIGEADNLYFIDFGNLSVNLQNDDIKDYSFVYEYN